jgi:hypothetical protein
MLKLACLTALLLCGCSNVLTNTDTQLKSHPIASQEHYERSLDSKTLNVRCQMPAFCCIQYENIVVDGKERKIVKGLCIGI